MKKKECIRCGELKEEKWRKTSYCGDCASKKSRVWELKNQQLVLVSIHKRRKIRQKTVCLQCGIEFQRKRGEKVCSVKCKLKNRSVTNNLGCWLYPSINSRGYSQFSFRGQKGSGHRISYTEFKGKIPEGLSICHKCDIPNCVNPEHLFADTPKANIQDGIRKGRIKHIGRKGNENAWTFITDAQIDEMKLLHKEGFGIERLSKIFNSNKEYISKIIREERRF